MVANVQPQPITPFLYFCQNVFSFSVKSVPDSKCASASAWIFLCSLYVSLQQLAGTQQKFSLPIIRNDLQKFIEQTFGFQIVLLFNKLFNDLDLIFCHKSGTPSFCVL